MGRSKTKDGKGPKEESEDKGESPQGRGSRPTKTVYTRRSDFKLRPMGRVYIFPRLSRKKFNTPQKFLENQRCIVCENYGCLSYMITPEQNGGQLTGDNLLPICLKCAYIPLRNLFLDHDKVRKWLVEHDRYDVLIYLKTITKTLGDPDV